MQPLQIPGPWASFLSLFSKTASLGHTLGHDSPVQGSLNAGSLLPGSPRPSAPGFHLLADWLPLSCWLQGALLGGGRLLGKAESQLISVLPTLRATESPGPLHTRGRLVQMQSQPQPADPCLNTCPVYSGCPGIPSGCPSPLCACPPNPGTLEESPKCSVSSPLYSLLCRLGGQGTKGLF